VTQPDKNLPTSAENYSSLGNFANKTQADWEAQNRAALAKQFDEAATGMLKILGPIPFIGDLLEILTGKEDGDYNDFGTAFNNWKKFWGANLTGLLKAIQDLFAPVKDLGDGLAAAADTIGKGIQDGVAFIAGGVAAIGTGIFGALQGIGHAVDQGLRAIQGVGDEIGKAAFGAVADFGAGVQGFVDGAGAGLQSFINQITGANTKADTAIGNNALTNIAVYQGYFGYGGATGEVVQVQETIAAIKTKIAGGYTLQTLTYNSDMVSQTIIVRPTSGGTYTLSYGGQTTSALAWNASAATVQTALRGLSTIGAGNVTVTDADAGFGLPKQFAFYVDFNTTAISSPTAITAMSSLSGGAVVDTFGIWRAPWTVADAPKELYAIAFGAGQAGGAGQNVVNTGYTFVSGGSGGAAGGYAAVEIDASTVTQPCVYYVAPGPAGSSSSGTGSVGGNTVFLVPAGLSLSTVAGQFFVSTVLGYYTSNQSAPGAGANGGLGYGFSGGVIYGGSNGANGAATLLAGGGAGGLGGANTPWGPNTTNTSVVGITANVGTVPVRGSIGGMADLTGRSRSGGGGGGGGGGAYSVYTTSNVTAGGIQIFPAGWTRAPGAAGIGGNGGFPGGGGGGGGGSFTYDYHAASPGPGVGAGSGGYGGNGVIILIWK
jgi:hypothetical protein